MEAIFSFPILAERHRAKNFNGLFCTVFYSYVSRNWIWNFLYSKKAISRFRSICDGNRIFILLDIGRFNNALFLTKTTGNVGKTIAYIAY
jgi:hypothetical protein